MNFKRNTLQIKLYLVLIFFYRDSMEFTKIVYLKRNALKSRQRLFLENIIQSGIMKLKLIASYEKILDIHLSNILEKHSISAKESSVALLSKLSTFLHYLSQQHCRLHKMVIYYWGFFKINSTNFKCV